MPKVKLQSAIMTKEVFYKYLDSSSVDVNKLILVSISIVLSVNRWILKFVDSRERERRER